MQTKPTVNVPHYTANIFIGTTWLYHPATSVRIATETGADKGQALMCPAPIDLLCARQVAIVIA